MMTTRALLVLAIVMVLPGCWLTNSYLWYPYQAPSSEADFVEVIAPNCPRIGIQNLKSVSDVSTLRQALDDVCTIMASDEFEQSVLAKTDWLATCNGTAENADEIDAAEVLRIVRLPKSDFSVMARKPINAIAQIDPQRRRLAIRKARFQQWRSGDSQEQSQLIVTLAHELTHFVRDENEPFYRFQDSDHGTETCPDNRLASYEVGEMVGRIWLAQPSAD